jgi:type I restriction enzyme, R subunit
MDKKSLSERDICTKFITPAILRSGWDNQKQLLEEVSFTNGKIIVQGRLTARGAKKRADYILYFKPNLRIAVIEAKDNKHSVRAGLQQALEYAQILDSHASSAAMVTVLFFMTEQQLMPASKPNSVLMNSHRLNNS